MHTAHSLIISPYLTVSHAQPPPPEQLHPLGATMHAPRSNHAPPRPTMHAPPQSNHTCPPEQPRMPPPGAIMHTPLLRVTKPYFPSSLIALVPIPIGTLLWHHHLPEHCGMDLQDYLDRISYNSHHNLFLEGVHQDRHLCSSVIVVHRPHSKKMFSPLFFSATAEDYLSVFINTRPVANGEWLLPAGEWFSGVLTWIDRLNFSRKLSQKVRKIKMNF